MNTIYFTEPTTENIAAAADIIRCGGLLGIPTETVYGLGANALDEEAVLHIFEAKGRPQDNPLIIHVPDASWLERYCKDVPASAHRLAERFWPGPLSVLFPARLRVPDILTGGTGRVAVRLSSHPVARALAEAVGEPITSSSANISGTPAVVSAGQLDKELLVSVRGVLDEPPAPAGGLPSTLVERLEDGTLHILRSGAVTPAELIAAGFEVKE